MRPPQGLRGPEHPHLGLTPPKGHRHPGAGANGHAGLRVRRHRGHSPGWGCEVFAGGTGGQWAQHHGGTFPQALLSLQSLLRVLVF